MKYPDLSYRKDPDDFWNTKGSRISQLKRACWNCKKYRKSTYRLNGICRSCFEKAVSTIRRVGPIDV